MEKRKQRGKSMHMMAWALTQCSQEKIRGKDNFFTCRRMNMGTYCVTSKE